jgi:hypothetical protein
MENTNTDTQITIADLDVLRNIVDLACTRGAFRGAELTQVGTIYDKLTQFLTAVIEQAKAQEEAKESTDNQSQGE